MICKLCGHVFDLSWVEKPVPCGFVDRRTGLQWDDNASHSEIDFDHAEELEACLLYPKKAGMFCERCWKKKVDKKMTLYFSCTLRYPMQSEEDIAAGLSNALVDAAKRLKKYGFYARCESISGRYAHIDGRCYYDASMTLPNGRKVCGHCYRIFLNDGELFFVGEECTREEPPSLKYAKLLLNGL